MAHAKFSGTRVFRNGNGIFVPIPRHLALPVDGGCDCSYCKAHPEITPLWDTIAICAMAPSNKYHDTVTTVHYPELQDKA